MRSKADETFVIVETLICPLQNLLRFSLLNEINDVIIASKIRIYASASAQNILPRKVFRKKQILLIYKILAFQKYQKLKYEVLDYK